VNAIWNWIKDVVSKIGNAFKSMGEGIKNVFNNVVNFFSGVVTKIKNLFGKIATTVGNAISNTVKKAINGVLSTAVKYINGFISAINVAISVINAIPGVNISKLNKLSVPQPAKGGIVDSATLAVVGERGKEAVMPLENNTEWIDILASRLAAYQGSDKPIVLQVDGKTFAQTSISAINNLTRKSGKLGLVIV
jgi:phage-related protein